MSTILLLSVIIKTTNLSISIHDMSMPSKGWRITKLTRKTEGLWKNSWKSRNQSLNRKWSKKVKSPSWPDLLWISRQPNNDRDKSKDYLSNRKTKRWNKGYPIPDPRKILAVSPTIDKKPRLSVTSTFAGSIHREAKVFCKTSSTIKWKSAVRTYLSYPNWRLATNIKHSKIKNPKNQTPTDSKCTLSGKVFPSKSKWISKSEVTKRNIFKALRWTYSLKTLWRFTFLDKNDNWIFFIYSWQNNCYLRYQFNYFKW